METTNRDTITIIMRRALKLAECIETTDLTRMKSYGFGLDTFNIEDNPIPV